MTLLLLQVALHRVFLTNKNSSPEYLNYSTLQITNKFLPKLKRKHKYKLYKLDSNLFWLQIVLHILTMKEMTTYWMTWYLRPLLYCCDQCVAMTHFSISVRRIFSRLCVKWSPTGGQKQLKIYKIISKSGLLREVVAYEMFHL